MKKVLTIAGSDCSGGAGIQADIKTIAAHKMYAMSAVTALTAQNTTGVYAVADATPEFLGQQLDCIFTDIFPDAVKIGMVSNRANIGVIAAKLAHYRARSIVLDPVMVATSGGRLIATDATEALLDQLLPLADVVTPNIPEAAAISGLAIQNENDMIAAAARIAAHYRGAILIKGGHLVNDAVDLLYQNGAVEWFRAPRIDNPNTHGTGCTLSSAIACGLADGLALPDAIRRAKAYLGGALGAMLDLGQGAGPLDHTWALPTPDF